MSDMDDLLKRITENVDVEHGKVLKRIPLKPEWKVRSDEFITLAEHLAEMMAKLKSLRNNFWTGIEIDTGHFINNMEFDREKNEIIVYEGPLNS